MSLEYCLPHLQTRKAVSASFALGYEMFGKPLALSGPYKREADLEARGVAVRWYKVMSSLCKERVIKAHPVKKLQGKWEGVLEGVEMLRNNSISGQKLVIRVD